MISILSFYLFTPLESDVVQSKADYLKKEGARLGLRGLVIVGQEGFNLTVCGMHEALLEFQSLFTHKWIAEWPDKPVDFKWSEADRMVFPRFKVKIKKEIVSLGRPGWTPAAKTPTHLPPAEFMEKLRSPDTVVIDTRNLYETRVGHFKNALIPDIQHFSEFPEYLKSAVQSAKVSKNQTVLIYCTGGIRCEKAIVEMHDQGFENVYQLDGGILNYFKALGPETSEQEWTGECFVFDHRVAVTTDLAPSSQYGLCPHCGDPSEVDVTCCVCARRRKLCVSCEKSPDLHRSSTCSKHCAGRLKNKTARNQHGIQIRPTQPTADGAHEKSPGRAESQA